MKQESNEHFNGPLQCQYSKVISFGSLIKMFCLKVTNKAKDRLFINPHTSKAKRLYSNKNSQNLCFNNQLKKVENTKTLHLYTYLQSLRQQE